MSVYFTTIRVGRHFDSRSLSSVLKNGMSTLMISPLRIGRNLGMASSIQSISAPSSAEGSSRILSLEDAMIFDDLPVSAGDVTRS